MFKFFEKIQITKFALCTNCDKEFEYKKQDKCPRCQKEKDYISFSDIPF